MNLSYLHYTKCPHCKAKPIKKSWLGTHANGGNFEEIQFSCFSRIEYVPNFNQERVVVPCPHSPEEKEKEVKRHNARTSLIEFIESLDVDESYKNKIIKVI